MIHTAHTNELGMIEEARIRLQTTMHKDATLTRVLLHLPSLASPLLARLCLLAAFCRCGPTRLHLPTFPGNLTDLFWTLFEESFVGCFSFSLLLLGPPPSFFPVPFLLKAPLLFLLPLPLLFPFLSLVCCFVFSSCSL